MAGYKCKNAVFSIVFFLFFIFGAICGALLFRMISQKSGTWIADYCLALSGAGPLSTGAFLFVLLRPVLLVLVAGMIPGGHRTLPILIFLRGCLMAYSASACFVTGVSPAFVIFRGVILLPLFYFFCRWVYLMQSSGTACHQANTQ